MRHAGCRHPFPPDGPVRFVRCTHRRLHVYLTERHACASGVGAFACPPCLQDRLRSKMVMSVYFQKAQIGFGLQCNVLVLDPLRLRWGVSPCNKPSLEDLLTPGAPGTGF